MRSRTLVLISLCLLLATGAWLFWLHGTHPSASTRTRSSALLKAAGPAVAQALPLTILSTNNARTAVAAAARTGQFRLRLSNTTEPIGELVNDRHAILLANALIDTSAGLNLSIPKPLQAPGEPGAYIVQASGPVDNAFRAMLARSGAQIVSYIPNNAYLVTASTSGAKVLAGNPMTQAVLPYEPYYKISSSMPVRLERTTSAWTPTQAPPAAQTSLLDLAMGQKPLPAGTYLTLGLFSGSEAATVAQIEKLGGRIVAREDSPLGPVVRVQPPADWVGLAALPGVHVVEPAYRRAPANDLSRARVGVALDPQAPTNYLNLSGSNVVVEVNDSGIDATHPDFDAGGSVAVRVIGDLASSLVDTNGHGTHVAGIIAGDGTESFTVTNAQGSPMPGSNYQFRGMAPAARLFSVGFLSGNDFTSDRYLQETPARTNALISNNSWNYDGDFDYDLAAASYDAAVRDALPQVTGSQPVLFVFAAGNAGNGDDLHDPGSGFQDSIESPATAKNVITVGAIQEFRNITNEVMTITVNSDGTTTTNFITPWGDQTGTSYRIAGFSGRGNVGIGTEGTFGRYKPDVVAPGTSIVSTRSSQWDIGTYFFQSPTNFNVVDFSVIVPAGSLGADTFPFVLTNTVQVTIQVLPNLLSPDPLPPVPIFYGLLSSPVYNYVSLNNQVSIPPDNGLTMADIFNSEDPFTGAFNYAVSNSTANPINFDVFLTTITTNNTGNYQLVFSNLDNSLGGSNPSGTGQGPYYRYETGTSMSAADVSGVLALMQDYFTNTLRTTPSPVLLKAMLINGARPTGAYDLQVQNNINFEGWGLINLPGSLPPGVTNVPSVSCSSFFIDQNPTNALATGDRHTFRVTIDTNTAAQTLPLRVTLAWTDPPGDPAAAVKLVNNLDLVVTNLDDPTHPVIFYGNDIGSGTIYNTPRGTNTPPNLDAINNVENVFISQPLGQNYSITVIGRDVNVNAVTAHTNNVVQDFALVVSCGEGEVTNAIAQVTDNGVITSASTTGQQITFLGGTNAPLLNQFVGASSPLLGTNTVSIGVITVLDTNGVATNAFPAFATNAIVTVGMTNQWHFYVVTNPPSGAFDVTNAGFITFLPDTLSIPRMGVFADSAANATTPEADIDLYVSTDSSLTNLNPAAISNCVHGTQVGLSTPAGVAGVFNGASLSRGGTEFVVDIRSTPGQVYYVGVKSERQMAAEYIFLPIFTSTPFSQMQNGNQLVNGQLLPVNIPDATFTGRRVHPGIAYTLGLAIFPMTVNQVVVNDSIVHDNYGDLIGTLNHSSIRDVLNNHDILNNLQKTYPFIYDDFPNSINRQSDGPGNLQSFAGTQGIGPWRLTEVDNSPTQIGYVSNYNLTITPNKDLTKGVNVLVGALGWAYAFIDVPVGFTNLTISGTNVSVEFGVGPIAIPPLVMFVKQTFLPTLADTNGVLLTNCLTGTFPTGTDPGNSISTGPPLTPGRYWVGVYNPSSSAQEVFLFASLAFSASAIETVDFRSGGPAPILDDAVTYAFITNNSRADLIQDFNVGLRVDHPRISDLVFHLISPDGTRYLLMENRGGTTTNGCGATILNNFFSPASSSGGPAASTNVIDTGETSGTLTINYNFFPVPDQMVVYYEGNVITNTGFISNAGQFNINYGPGSSTFVTIVMNPTGNPNTNTLWEYTASGSQTNYLYLAFTEDTNLTTTPIKFAPPPFAPSIFSTNFVLSDFETATPGDYTNPATISDESVWSVVSNQVSVVIDPPNAQGGGSQFLALANGIISNSMVTVPGVRYTLTYGYRGPGIVSWWRGESNVVDSINGHNGTFLGDPRYNTNGEVGQAFQFTGNGSPSSRINVPDSTDFILTNALTVEGWAWASNVFVANELGVFLMRGDDRAGLDPYLIFLDHSSQNFYFRIQQNNTAPGTSDLIYYLGSSMNQWVHLACTWDARSGFQRLYLNGVVVTQQVTSVIPLANLSPAASPGIGIGNNQGPIAYNSPWLGSLDEVSLYRRALSASEIKAIYTLGRAGKFDNNTEVPVPQDLAEATVTIPGAGTSVILGDNTNWQTGTITFTANGTSTPLIISGIEPGILLDNFNLSGSSGGRNLYYQPEQDISGINNQSAFGTWTLEIQDDRAGTANGILQSWQLEFSFANTNFIPISPIIPGQPGTNVIPPGGVLYFAVNVPANADMATNILLFSTGPKNIWYDTNNPPTTNIFLFGGTGGSFILSTTGSAPTNLVPGSTYYIVEQNTNSFAITNAFEVDFHFVPGILTPFAFTQPAYAVTGTGAQLNGMATPNGLPATAWFQWGTSTAYGNQTPPVSVGTGSSVVYTASPISGLLPNVPYHCRLVVSNALAVTYGFDQILDEANVVVWGANYAGQLKVPPGLSNVVAIAGAYDHSLTLKNDETAVAWGDNLYGEAIVPAGLSNLVAVAGGESYSLALQNNGTVAAWGSDIYPGAGETNVPASLSNVVMIASGQYSSLALQTNGSVMAWGANLFNPTNIPAGLSNVVAIAGGTLHNLAIKNDGTVVAWGDNGAGQTNVPANLTNVVAIAAGSFHSLALKSDGTVVAWGFDSAGQTNVPVGLNNVVAIAAGGFHSLALKNDGSIVAWGDNSAGQASVPVGLSNVVAIASGYLHSLALTPLFNVNSTNPIVLNTTNGVAQTNNILAGGIVYYQVNVPANADFATNRLLFALQGPLNVWFDTNNPPTTNVFLFNGTNGSSTLSITSAPPLVPGSTYYLGVQNTNSFTVTYGIEVDFHLLPLPSPSTPVSITATNIGGKFGFLLTWYAPTNDIFMVQWTPSLAPQTWTSFTNIITYPGPPPPLTNGIGQFRFFDDGTQFAFGPARFYQVLLVTSLAGGGPATNSIPGGSLDYFLVNVPPNADLATNLLLSATGPVNLWFNPTNPPAGANPPDDLLMGGATNGISVLSTTSVPTNIVPGGTYWLGVQNTNSFAVTFSLGVNFHLTAANLSISSITFTNLGGTNSFLLRWLAPTNDVFQVQWTDTLSPQNWQFFTNFIYYPGPPPPPANGIGQFWFLDDGSQTPPGLPPMRFYRIILDGTVPSTHTNTVSISSITTTNVLGTNNFLLTWSAPTNYTFELQWTTNLLPVITWQTSPNLIGYSTYVSPTNSLFSFFDNGSQGGLGPIRFYRLLLLP